VTPPAEPDSEIDVGVIGEITISLNTKATSTIILPFTLAGAYGDLVLDDDIDQTNGSLLLVDKNPNDDSIEGQITIGTGESTKTIYVFANNDYTYEADESVTLTLLPETPATNNIASGSGYRLDLDKNKAPILIGDNEPTVTLGAVKDLKEGSATGDFISYVDVELDQDVTKGPGLFVFYSITGGTATQFDYLNTQGRITTSSNADDVVFIPKGARSARLYLSALPDAIAEENETIMISLLDDQNPNDSPTHAIGNNYAIGTNITTTVNIIDSGAFVPSLAILDRLGSAVTTAGVPRQPPWPVGVNQVGR